MTSAIVVSLVVEAAAVGVEDMRLTLDAGHVPFAQAQVTVPIEDAIADDLDPRALSYGTLSVVRQFSGTFPVSDLTAYAGGDVAAWTAAVGGSAATVTGMFTHPFPGTTPAPSTRRDARLGLRSRVLNHLDATATLTFASDEARLQDYRLLSTAVASPVALTVQSCVELALAIALPGAYLSTIAPAASSAVAADAAAWEPGESAWSYLVPIVSAAGLRLWCDELQVWHLDDPTTLTAPGVAVLSTTTNVTQATDQVSRDSDLWADGVIVVYDWTDSSNVRHVVYDVAGETTASRMVTITHNRPRPAAGEAAARLRKLQGQGRQLDVTAVIDPTVYPSQDATLTTSGVPTQTGRVQAVTLEVPADVMRVTTESLTDTGAYAWIAQPDGYRWQDVPAGVHWNTYTPPGA